MKLKSYSAILIILLSLSGITSIAMLVFNSPFLERIAIASAIFALIVGLTWALRKLNKPDSEKPED